jgi:DNA-directed RNA polymerase subunit K/omega
MEDKISMFDKAIEKVGGAFELTVLIQKRVKEIIAGASPLIPVSADMSPIDIALREVLDDKIALVEPYEIKEKLLKKEPEKAPAKKKKKKK